MIHAYHHTSNTVVMSDFNESFKLYLSSCYLESSSSLPFTTVSKQQGIVKTNDGKGLFYPPSCFNAARQYLAGKGTEQSDKEAFKALVRSCESGSHAGACHHLGTMLLSKDEADDRGVPYDGVRGLGALSRACEEGDGVSCHLGGSVLLDNTGRYKDVQKKYGGKEGAEKESERMLVKGCEGGMAKSCYNLAVMYKRRGDEDKFQEYKNITEGMVKRGEAPGVAGGSGVPPGGGGWPRGYEGGVNKGDVCQKSKFRILLPSFSPPLSSLDVLLHHVEPLAVRDLSVHAA